MQRTVTTSIAIKRVLLNLKTFRFVAGVLVCLSIIVSSGVVSVHDFNQRTNYCQSLELEHRQQLREAKSYNQVSARLILKPTALSLASEGVGERFGLAARIPGRWGSIEVFGRTNANSFLAAFRSLDLAHIIGLLLTLMALLFTYDAVSGEREAGTLQLSLANSLPRYKILLGEYLGALLSLVLPLIGCFLLWLALVRIYGGITFESVDWLRVSLILLASILVVSLFVLLGMVISCSMRQSSTSIMLCLFLWVFLGGLYPNFSSWTATKLSPIALRVAQEFGPERPVDMQYPTKAEIRKMMLLPPEQQEAKARELKKQSREMASHYVTSMEVEKDAEFRHMVSQARFVETSQILSPISSYIQLASILAGTDLGNYIRFRGEARRLDGELARWQEEMVQKYPQVRGAFAGSLDLNGLPQSSYRPEALAESLSRVLPPALVLLALHLLCFFTALLMFIRYDPR
jgi:ABC-type transport system involved in multi-copper enzyme maturation permease subunit